jgi:hypothetical protein
VLPSKMKIRDPVAPKAHPQQPLGCRHFPPMPAGFAVDPIGNTLQCMNALFHQSPFV